MEIFRGNRHRHAQIGHDEFHGGFPAALRPIFMEKPQFFFLGEVGMETDLGQILLERGDGHHGCRIGTHRRRTEAIQWTACRTSGMASSGPSTSGSRISSSVFLAPDVLPYEAQIIAERSCCEKAARLSLRFLAGMKFVHYDAGVLRTPARIHGEPKEGRARLDQPETRAMHDPDSTEERTLALPRSVPGCI